MRTADLVPKETAHETLLLQSRDRRQVGSLPCGCFPATTQTGVVVSDMEGFCRGLDALICRTKKPIFCCVQAAMPLRSP